MHLNFTINPVSLMNLQGLTLSSIAINFPPKKSQSLKPVTASLRKRNKFGGGSIYADIWAFITEVV